MIARSLRWVGLSTLAFVGCEGNGSAGVPAAPTEVAVAATAPATVTTIDREGLVALMKTPAGKPRIVNFWATWCGPCVAEIPEILAFAAEHPEAEVVLVNLDYISLTKTHVVPFVERHQMKGVRVLQVDDEDPAAAVAYAIPEWPSAIPYTVVLAPDGAPVARHSTAVDRAKLVRGLELASAPR